MQILLVQNGLEEEFGDSLIGEHGRYDNEQLTTEDKLRNMDGSHTRAR